MNEKSEEQASNEEQPTEMDKEVNRMILFGAIVAAIILVPALVVMYVAM